MILLKIYNEKEKSQEVWYDSSNLYYSKMVEDPNANKGDLYVMFKTGKTYRYKGVSLGDYVSLVGGGGFGSNGKALNRIIKGKYEYELVESGFDKEALQEKYERLRKSIDEVAPAMDSPVLQKIEKNNEGFEERNGLNHVEGIEWTVPEAYEGPGESSWETPGN